MHKKKLLNRTGRFTAEYRSTYQLSYRYEMPDRIVYFTQEAVENAHVDNWKGHVVEVLRDGEMAGSISPSQKVLLRSAIACGTLENCSKEFVFEYEVDYE